jgi:hypothetical protein
MDETGKDRLNTIMSTCYDNFDYLTCMLRPFSLWGVVSEGSFILIRHGKDFIDAQIWPLPSFSYTPEKLLYLLIY